MRAPKWLLLSTTAPIVGAFPLEERQTSGVTGPYAAGYSTDPALPIHTIYTPKSVSADVKLPVLVWGEGGCAASGTAFARFLTEIASYGYIIFASGAPGGTGTTTSKLMVDALDFVNKTRTSIYAQADLTKIAAAGMSCGGLEALDMKDEPRVGHIGVFNSGYRADTARATTIKKPTFFFLGGPSDIAYENGERDYKSLPAGTPSWKGNLPVGHGGTYSQPNGGKFGVAAVHWVNWVLKGNQTAAKWFVDGSPQKDGWTVEHKNLELIMV